MTTDLHLSYENHDDDSVKCINATPCPDELSDDALLVSIAALSRVLAKRHGLERAIKLVEDACYGRLPDGESFEMKCTPKT